MCCCTGAVNVNFTGMMKKRFMSGKIGLYDLVPTEEGREKFKVRMNTKCEGQGMCMDNGYVFYLHVRSIASVMFSELYELANCGL